MQGRKSVDITLWILLAIGSIGAVKVSYTNLTGNPCPHLWIVPICYVVLLAYGLMIAALVIPHHGCKHYFFAAGWAAAFVIAFLGSAAEIMVGGGVCPSSGGGNVRGSLGTAIPLCYISLALTVGILLLFLIGPYKRACDSLRRV